jgi:hypothetical protein
MGKCVVKAENRRIAVAYSEDGLTSALVVRIPNINGFIASVDGEGGSAGIIHRNDHSMGMVNHPGVGPWFEEVVNSFGLFISDNCHLNERSQSRLGRSYGSGQGLNRYFFLDKSIFDMRCLRL